jgi:hypothetical protein
VVVNVDENFPLRNASAGLAQPLEAGAVYGNDTIEFETTPRLLEQSVGVQKFVFLRDRVLVPANDFFAFVLQRQRQPELRADAIAIGPDMADDADGFAPANGVENAVNDFRVTFHQQWVGRAVLCPPLVRQPRTARTE